MITTGCIRAVAQRTVRPEPSPRGPRPAQRPAAPPPALRQPALRIALRPAARWPEQLTGAPSPRPRAATNSAQHVVAAVLRLPAEEPAGPAWCRAPGACSADVQPARLGGHERARERRASAAGGRRRAPGRGPCPGRGRCRSASSSGSAARLNGPGARRSSIRTSASATSSACTKPTDRSGSGSGSRRATAPGRRGRRRTAAARGSSGRSRCRPRAAGPGSAGRRSSVVAGRRAEHLAHDVLGLGLVAAVLRGRDAGDRPVLGDPLADGRRRVGAERGHVHDVADPGGVRRARHPAGALDVDRRSRSGRRPGCSAHARCTTASTPSRNPASAVLARGLARGRRGATAPRRTARRPAAAGGPARAPRRRRTPGRSAAGAVRCRRCRSRR